MIKTPILEYYFKDNQLGYRWTNCVSGFNMPVKVVVNGTEKWLKPETEWNSISAKTENAQLKIDKNFYVAGFNVSE